MSCLHTGFYETGRRLWCKRHPYYEKEEIEPAFREAMKSTKTPYILEFDIDPEDLVYPMVKPGGTLEDLIMDC